MAPHRDQDELPWRALALSSERGPVQIRAVVPAGATAGVAMVGGVGGGFDTPARDLYPVVAEAVTAAGHAALRVRFRDPRSLAEAEHDLRTGLAFLADRGVTRLALVGHSFGGAVVIRAAVGAPQAVGVVTLATQAYGADAVRQLRIPMLLIHGEADRVLPHRASASVAAAAGGPAELHTLPAVGHDLLEARDRVHGLVVGWLLARLGEAPDAGERAGGRPT